MKKLIPVFLMFLLVVSCKDECKDEFCPSGYECVDGVCERSDGGCPTGYEGEDCATASNEKFAGNYDTDYSGTGGLSASTGNTTAKVVTVNGTANKIRIDVDLDVEGNILGTAIPLPLTISIVGETDEDTYTVSSTTIQTSVDIQGLGALPVELTFEVEGTKVSDSQLNSTLTMSGLLTGTVEMTGTK